MKYVYILKGSYADNRCAPFTLKWFFQDLESLEKYVTTPGSICEKSVFKKISSDELPEYREVPEDDKLWNVIRLTVSKFELFEEQ